MPRFNPALAPIPAHWRPAPAAHHAQRAIGEAITARSIAIDYYQGLGPPDLCCVTKQVCTVYAPSDINIYQYPPP